MLTKEEVLENWNMFVGSQATNYGEDLTRNHDELWAPDIFLCDCVRPPDNFDTMNIHHLNKTFIPSFFSTTAPTAPLFPYWNGSGVSGSGPQTNTVDTQGSWSYHVTLQVFLTFRNITGVFQSYPPQRLCLRNERCHCQKLETAKLMWNCSRSFLFISHVMSNLRI